ncbi:MAG: response regulator [Syntrophobacteraceae bacterium]|jgi:DNA-binding response OmpR family regulator
MGYRLKILLIGDDEDDQLIIQDLVSEIAPNGYRLERVSTYGAALEAIRRRGHDVYLLDCQLGERSGLELLHEVGADSCRAPFILLSADGDDELQVSALKAGVADYLVKSDLSAPLLERAIRYAVERRRVQHGL